MINHRIILPVTPPDTCPPSIAPTRNYKLYTFNFKLSRYPPHLPLKEVRPHRVEEERGHRGISVVLELLAVPYNLKKQLHATLGPTALAKEIFRVNQCSFVFKFIKSSSHERHFSFTNNPQRHLNTRKTTW